MIADWTINPKNERIALETLPLREEILRFSRGRVLRCKNGHSLQKIQREEAVQCHKP